jgi:DnaJ-domain-containing protein 1
MKVAADLTLSADERELLADYRAALANERVVLQSLLMKWPSLHPAHKGLVYRVADALQSATAWKQGDQHRAEHFPTAPDPGVLAAVSELGTVIERAVRLVRELQPAVPVVTPWLPSVMRDGEGA